MSANDPINTRRRTNAAHSANVVGVAATRRYVGALRRRPNPIPSTTMIAMHHQKPRASATEPRSHGRPAVAPASTRMGTASGTASGTYVSQHGPQLGGRARPPLRDPDADGLREHATRHQHGEERDEEQQEFLGAEVVSEGLEAEEQSRDQDRDVEAERIGRQADDPVRRRGSAGSWIVVTVGPGYALP